MHLKVHGISTVMYYSDSTCQHYHQVAQVWLLLLFVFFFSNLTVHTSIKSVNMSLSDDVSQAHGLICFNYIYLSSCLIGHSDILLCSVWQQSCYLVVLWQQQSCYLVVLSGNSHAIWLSCLATYMLSGSDLSGNIHDIW